MHGRARGRDAQAGRGWEGLRLGAEARCAGLWPHSDSTSAIESAVAHIVCREPCFPLWLALLLGLAAVGEGRDE